MESYSTQRISQDDRPGVSSARCSIDVRILAWHCDWELGHSTRNAPRWVGEVAKGSPSTIGTAREVLPISDEDLRDGRDRGADGRVISASTTCDRDVAPTLRTLKSRGIPAESYE